MKSQEISNKKIIGRLILALLLQIIPLMGSERTFNRAKAWLSLVM